VKCFSLFIAVCTVIFLSTFYHMRLFFPKRRYRDIVKNVYIDIAISIDIELFIIGPISLCLGLLCLQNLNHGEYFPSFCLLLSSSLYRPTNSAKPTHPLLFPSWFFFFFFLFSSDFSLFFFSLRMGRSSHPNTNMTWFFLSFILFCSSFLIAFLNSLKRKDSQWFEFFSSLLFSFFSFILTGRTRTTAASGAGGGKGSAGTGFSLLFFRLFLF
jgi:hypothetical protein